MDRLSNHYRNVSQVARTLTVPLTKTSFKIVDNHHIKADIVLPPNLKPGKHPLLIAYHGGYLIGGARNCYAAIGPWVPAYAASTSAIILAPDYRLFPSASTADVLSDLEDLWQWIHSTLPDVLSVKAPGHEVDLQKILVEGHSAGGFCAAHLSISHAESIRASILVYPMVDPFSPGVSGKPVEAMVTGAPLTGEELEKKIEAVRQEGWVTERVDSDGWLLMLSLLDGGKFGECFGDNKDHSPVNRVRGMKRPLPRT